LRGLVIFGFQKHEEALLMFSDVVIKIENLSKSYLIYDKPQDRLKQMLFPRLQRLLGLTPRQYYHQFNALEDVTFEVRKGETVGIIGKNGSGKSTLLQIICGTLQPTSGKVETVGRIAALLELGSGFNPEFSGRDNVYMYATILGLTEKEVSERYVSIIEFADIGEFIEQPTKTYSSGMVVRLAFAVITHVDADVLIIDEALSVGDAFFVQKCMRFLRNFMKTGTVLFVSHDTSAILNLCDTAVWLDQGVVKGIGEPKDLTERYLELLYDSPQASVDISKEIKLIARIKAEVEHHEEDIDSSIVRDMRQNFINQSNLRNDIELFEFYEDSNSFGQSGAKIKSVHFLDQPGAHLSWVVGGEKVNLVINVKAYETLFSPIVGFQVKDRLGQVIFADNTHVAFASLPVEVSAGDNLRANFNFVMPVMPLGEYTISVAIADGSQASHIQHHWLHDALAFKVHSSSVCLGLIGVPMINIGLVKV
jgi:lipopolysaccharide transport system ATP-binding protein